MLGAGRAEWAPAEESPVETERQPTAATEAFARAGFCELGLSQADWEDQPKYWATRDNGSRWLLDPRAGLHMCYSDVPWSAWRLTRDGRLVNDDTGQSRIDAPAANPPPRPQQRVTPPANPVAPAVSRPAQPAAPTGGTQLSLF